MGYSVKRLDNESIIIVTYIAPMDANVDIPCVHEETAELLKHISGVLYRVVDLSPANMSFKTVMDGLLLSSRSESGGTADPRIRTVTVGTDEMTQLVSEAFKQEQYGGFNVPLFSSLDAGIAYARAELAKEHDRVQI